MICTGEELLCRPREAIDLIVATQTLAVLAKLEETAKPHELATLRHLNLAKAVEWREALRLRLLKELRSLGYELPDDFGALPESDRRLLTVETVGSA